MNSFQVVKLLVRNHGRTLIVSLFLLLLSTSLMALPIDHSTDQQSSKVLFPLSTLSSERLNVHAVSYDAEIAKELVNNNPMQCVKEPLKSLWSHLRIEGRLLHHLDHPLIDEELAKLVEHKFWTKRSLQAASPYLHHILTRLNERDLPPELALLPLIESGFKPSARSHLNAVGLWQLVPATAESLGLTINNWVDERKDVVKSTEAALDYLELMYEDLGSWPLAIAAYNAGPSRIRYRIKKLGKPVVSVWDLSLPPETRHYVAKLFALDKLIAHAEDYAFELPEIPNTAYFVETTTQQRISLKKAADLAGVTLEQLAPLNRSLLKKATPPEGPHSLVIPVVSQATFERNLSSALANNQRLYEPKTFHTVQAGESLSVIAENYNVPVKELQRLNKLQDTKIRSGQRLIIERDEELLAVLDDDRYQVRKGDTLSEIANLYGIDHSHIATENNIHNNDLLRVGKILIIPAYYKEQNRIQYTIKNGDTLSEIADQFHIPLQVLKSMNPLLQTNDTIVPGQQVIIPRSSF